MIISIFRLKIVNESVKNKTSYQNLKIHSGEKNDDSFSQKCMDGRPVFDTFFDRFSKSNPFQDHQDFQNDQGLPKGEDF